MKNTIPGARFAARKNVFRPTTMSLAMAAAGIIPAPHIVNERALTGVVQSKNDPHGLGRSVSVAF
jgi:hypothetical protein